MAESIENRQTVTVDRYDGSLPYTSPKGFASYNVFWGMWSKCRRVRPRRTTAHSQSIIHCRSWCVADAP